MFCNNLLFELQTSFRNYYRKFYHKNMIKYNLCIKQLGALITIMVVNKYISKYVLKIPKDAADIRWIGWQRWKWSTAILH